MSRGSRRPARVSPPVRGRLAAERSCATPVMPPAERLTCAQVPHRPRRPLTPPRTVMAPVLKPVEQDGKPPVDVSSTDPPAGLFALILLILAVLLLLGLLLGS